MKNRQSGNEAKVLSTFRRSTKYTIIKFPNSYFYLNLFSKKYDKFSEIIDQNYLYVKQQNDCQEN